MTALKERTRNTPVKFFKRLGLVEMPPEAIRRALQKVGGQQYSINLEKARNEGKERSDWKPFYELLHYDLATFIANVSHDIPRMVRTAELIAELDPVPNMRVLDIGGGPGHLAFWTAVTWANARVTVLDSYGGKIGEVWKQKLRTDRVNFKEGNWEDLNPEQYGPYDFAVISSVLYSNSAMSALTAEANFQIDQPEASVLTIVQQQGINALRAFFECVTPVMDPVSSLLLIEPWTPTSARLLALSLEGTEWGFDIAYSHPSRVKDHSVSLFVLSRGSENKSEYFQAAACALTLPHEMQELWSAGADAFRRAFKAEVKGRLSMRYDDGHIMHVEVFEGESLGGVYEQATNGYSRLLWGSLFHRAQYHAVLEQYYDATQSGTTTLLEKTGLLFEPNTEVHV